MVLSGSRPVIGLTTYLEQAQTGVWDVLASFLPEVYFQGVTAAGGVATLLPPQPVDSDIAERVLDGLDGLLITGGKDVDLFSALVSGMSSQQAGEKDRS